MLVMKRSLRLGFGLILLTTAAWAQTAEETALRWFRVSWAPPTDSHVATIRGSVFNDSPYRVTNVRLEVEGVDANRHSVGRMQAWAIGDIAPGGETWFVAEPMPGAATYRARVVFYDLVSLGQVP